MLKIAVTAALIGVLPGVALAVPCPSAIPGCSRPAPAPLLAAGVPAFLALGGGALVARLPRRKRDNGPSSGAERAASES